MKTKMPKRWSRCETVSKIGMLADERKEMVGKMSRFKSRCRHHMSECSMHSTQARDCSRQKQRNGSLSTDNETAKDSETL